MVTVHGFAVAASNMIVHRVSKQRLSHAVKLGVITAVTSSVTRSEFRRISSWFLSLPVLAQHFHRSLCVCCVSGGSEGHILGSNAAGSHELTCSWSSHLLRLHKVVVSLQMLVTLLSSAQTVWRTGEELVSGERCECAERRNWIYVFFLKSCV